MIKEYCDKCKKEIPGEDREKKIVQISFPRKSYTGYDQCECAKLTLCKECFEGMGIANAVKSVGAANRTEKEPTAVEKLVDIIRELITECLEEQGE